MTFHLQLILATLVVTSCSTTPARTDSKEKLPPQSSGSLKSDTNLPVPVSKPEEPEARPNDVLSYFYKVYPRGSGKPVEGLSFLEEDIKNGYLRVTGNMEGYFVFALFRADKSDWLVQQSTGCGPECEQSFLIYQFENGKLASTKKLESLFPKLKVDAHVASLRRKLPRASTNEELQSWLRLPQRGTSIDVLILDQNPGFTSGKVSVYQAGKLNWNGAGFDFVPLNPTRPSSIEITTVH